MEELLQYDETIEQSASSRERGKHSIMDRTTQIVLKYFPYSEIIDNSGYTTVHVYCTNPEYYSRILGNMIEFHIMDTHIHVETLIKCDSLNGTSVINYIINIAYELRATIYHLLSYISLTDGSSLVLEDIILDIRTLYILMYGESWYNQRGFYSDRHMDNVSHNARIRQSPIGSFPELLGDIDPSTTVGEVVTYLYKRKMYQPLQRILLHMKDHVRYKTALRYKLH